MKALRFWAVLVTILVAATSVSAQVTSNLTGRVVLDGNSLPGVTVTISSRNLQGTRRAMTDVNGIYNFTALPPGTYTLRYEMESMQTVTRTTRVGLGQTSRVDANMDFSSVAEAITVTAAAPMILVTSEVQSNFPQQLVDDLPMSRTFQAQANLAPNVTTNSPVDGQLVISGAPAHENLYMINGAVINENLRGQIHGLFIEDAIQETTVMSGAITAEYGRFTGGVVNAITKSGGNEFSGSIRDSLTNPSWTARSYAGQPSFSDTINSVYEATLGGRIILDRLWFFSAARYAQHKNDRTLYGTDVAFEVIDEQTRLEGKLTGQLSPRQSMMVSYLDVRQPQNSVCFLACYEISNVDPQRELPNSFLTVHYSGIFTNNLLGEVHWSQKKFAFEDSGGHDMSFAGGTWGRDVNTQAFFGAPVFCGVCGPEERNNDYLDAKLTYYIASPTMGTHNFTGGYQDWAEQRISNNFQSGSSFGMNTFARQTPITSPEDEFHPVIAPGDRLLWFPIFELSRGNEFRTRSLYVNDKWDLNNYWQFNVGIRFDKNDGVDAAGAKVVDDSILSPRLGVLYDVFGNGRLRLNASYGHYVAKMAENIGSVAAANGNPAYVAYSYEGPEISGLPTREAFGIVEEWFQSVGGTGAMDRVMFASFPGVNTRIDGSLRSPNVREFTIGAGTHMGRGYVRADVISRKWADFYATRVDSTTGQVLDPFNHPVDLELIESSNEGLRRTYRGISVQGGYPFSEQFQLGGNYTWSQTKGNVTAEERGSGPVTEMGPNYYPELTRFAQNNPSGFLTSDQTHKIRAWATLAIPTAFGNFTLSALQRFDSGTAYSATGTVNFVSNGRLGYARPNQYAGTPAMISYYFGDRGEHRWDDIHSTDLSLNYRLRLGGRAELFLQPEIINVFNNDAVYTGNTTVFTADNDRYDPVKNPDGLRPFNPFTETPVEGVHYRLHERFGQDRDNYLDFQQARTYRVSVGVRF